MLRAPAFLLTSLVMLLVGSPRTARADRYSIHGTASLDAAATDNVFSAGGDFSNRDPDLMVTVRPGILFTYAQPRFVQEINAEMEAMRYAAHSDQPSLAFRGGYKALIVPGPLSEMLIQANASKSLLSAISAAGAPQDAVIALQPIGQVDVLQGDFNEYASRTLTRELRTYQNAFARAGKTDDNGMPRTVVTSGETGASFGLDRSWPRDSISVEAGASVLRLERKADPGAPMGSRLDKQINPRGRALWRHDWNRKVSSSIDGGLAVVIPFGTDPYHPDVKKHMGEFPIVGAALAYNDVWGVATLQLRRDVTPNLFVAANTVNSVATFAAAMPLPWLQENRRAAPKLAGVGSFGVQRTQLIEEDTANLQSSFYVAMINAGIQYAPRPGLTYMARYELLYQSGDRAPALGEPTPGFYRNTIYLSASVRFPADVAVRVPKRRTSSVRADRKDLTPIGAEPVVPDLVEQGGEGGEGGGD